MDLARGLWEAAAASTERQAARPANVASRRAKRDRHNSARHEYCLVKRLVAVAEAIRSKQRRVATIIFVIIIIIITESASVIWRFPRLRVFRRLWINEKRANSALAKRA